MNTSRLGPRPTWIGKTALWLAAGLAILSSGTPAQAFRPQSDLSPSAAQIERTNLMTELATIRQRWPQMTPAERNGTAQLYLPTPVGDNRKSASRLAKIEQSTTVTGATIIKTPHCRIIFGSSYASYVNKGGTAYSLGLWSDNDKDGLPKFIELLVGGDPKVVESSNAFQENSSGIMETIWAKEINAMGFPAPPGTDDAYLDIYVANTGVKNPAVDFNGSKGITLPSTIYGVTSTYQNGQPYLILSQDMATSILQVTAAHEFFHAVQVGYVDYDTMIGDSMILWLAESTATWMEDVAYPLVNDYVNYVWQLTDSPQWSLFDPDLVYSAVLFQKYLTENFHAADNPDGSAVIKALWTGVMPSGDVLAAVEGFLNAQTANPRHTLAAAYADFAVKNLDLPANYSDGGLYDPVKFTKTIQIDPAQSPKWNDAVSGYWQAPSHYGSTYLKVEIKEGGLSGLANRLQFDLAGDTLPQWHLQVVPIAADGSLGPTVAVDLGGAADGQIAKEDNELYTTAYVVVSALPAPKQALNALAAYNYTYTVDAHLATRLTAGWNLQHVPSLGLQTYGDGLQQIISAWRWPGGEDATWEVAFPTAAPEDVDAYLQAKGFAKLTTIEDDDGVWLNSAVSGVEEGAADATSEQALIIDTGWNLLASRVPARVALSPLATGQGPLTFWKWDAISGNWAFYSSAMDAEQTLADYTAGKGFILLSTISYGEGFWVNSEAPTILTLQ